MGGGKQISRSVGNGAGDESEKYQVKSNGRDCS